MGLLKVNVERAELEVLQGLEQRHWAGVRQVSAQVSACQAEGGKQGRHSYELHAGLPLIAALCWVLLGCPQVHDIGGRLAAVRELLQGAGFARVEVFQEPRFRGCCLYMVYASRA